MLQNINKWEMRLKKSLLTGKASRKMAFWLSSKNQNLRKLLKSTRNSGPLREHYRTLENEPIITRALNLLPLVL